MIAAPAVALAPLTSICSPLPTLVSRWLWRSNTVVRLPLHCCSGLPTQVNWYGWWPATPSVVRHLPLFWLTIAVLPLPWSTKFQRWLPLPWPYHWMTLAPLAVEPPETSSTSEVYEADVAIETSWSDWALAAAGSAATARPASAVATMARGRPYAPVMQAPLLRMDTGPGDPRRVRRRSPRAACRHA